MASYLVVLDTPGIKQFVFGADALAEIRGASALLDDLNRNQTERKLQAALGDDAVRTVFANGGAAQFIVTVDDRRQLEQALAELLRYYREQTGGEMRPVYGVAALDDRPTYQQAVQRAFAALQLQRQCAFGHRAVPLLPILLECQSTSYLPVANANYTWGNERLQLSQAAIAKRDAIRRLRRQNVWYGWLEWLEQQDRAIAGTLQEYADDLRPPTISDIGSHQDPLRPERDRRGYIGLIYADGNAMGQLVQELDGPEVTAAFSELVDGSIRTACYQALQTVCRREIQLAVRTIRNQESPRPLPADILLLGGDDLLVLLPARRALDFALEVTARFEQLTREGQQSPQFPESAKAFFRQRGLDQSGLTISCGVVIARDHYPFYLLLELAQELLDSAKKGGHSDPDRAPYWSPAYIDFHAVAGSVTQELEAIRRDDYQCDSNHPRTLRPYRRERLLQLRDAARQLQQAAIPKSKLHDLFAAATEPRPALAQLQAEELFGRLRQDDRHPQRTALWNALQRLGPLDPYPWLRDGRTARTALADLVEAAEWFGEE